MSPRRRRPRQDIPEAGPLFGHTIYTDRRGVRWGITVEYLDVDGRLTPCGISWRSFEVVEDGAQLEARSLNGAWQEVTTAAIKVMPVATLTAKCRRTVDRHDVDDLDYFTDHMERREAGETVQPLDRGRLEAIVRRVSRYSRLQTGGRPRYDLEHWQAVATVYRQAYADGGPPSAAVADRFKVSRNTARQWVRRCRQLELLPTTDERRSRA